MAANGAQVDLGQSSNGTRFVAEATSEPWLLDLDALVISVGSEGLGKLGYAVQDVLPEFDLGTLPLGELSPDDPVVTAVPRHSAFVPEWLILVSGRERQTRAGSLDAVDHATRAAMAAASAWAVRRIGLPMVGAGVIGLDRAAVARTILDAARDWVQTRPTRLEAVVLFDRDPRITAELTAAWDQLGSPDATGVKALRFSTRARRVFDGTRAVAGPEGPPSSALLWLTALTNAFYEGQRDVAGILLGRLSNRTGRRSGEVLADLSATLGVKSPAASELSEAPSSDIPWLHRADDIATATGSAIIRQRHLLAAAVSDQTFDTLLSSGLRLSLDELKGELRSAIAELKPDEFPDVWDGLLQPGSAKRASDAESDGAESASSSEASHPPPSESPSNGPVYDEDILAGGLSPDIVDPDRRIPLAEDHLGVTTYVQMLASLIARVDTPPPLSIGLFGEWGSGKSYFMGLLRHEIDDLCSPGTGRGYHQKVEQITFNAWHYSDTNIWASLADEIFEELAGTRESVDEKRTRLRRELSEKLEREGILTAAVAQTQREVKQLKAEVERSIADRASSAKGVLAALASTPTFRTELDRAWLRLGVADDVEKAELVARQLNDMTGDIKTIRMAGTRRLGIAVGALLVAGVVVAGSSLFFSAHLRNWLIGTGLGTVTTALGVAAGLVGWAHSGVRILRDVLLKAKQEAEASAGSVLAKSMGELRMAEQEETRLQDQLRTLKKEAEELSGQVDNLAPGKRLYSFVHERVSSGDYGRQLGLISMIRHDFETLVEIMNDWRKHPELHGTDEAVDRIVLYIDDLDRCQPRQVVEVLQAVHLLLALELFVVVVGVDPRWLRQSLLAEYPRTLANDDLAPGGAIADWMGTPNDYLEKLINIPFVLPGMTPENFGTLIRGWGAARTANGSGAAGEPAVVGANGERDDAAMSREFTGSAPASAGPGEVDSSVTMFAPITREVGSDLDALRQRSGSSAPEPTPLQDIELTALALLGPLVKTPRDAKRLLNLYRMVRSAKNLGSNRDFLGHQEYQATALLLGLLTAEPALFAQLLWARPNERLKTAGGLMYRKNAVSWKTAWDGLAPRLGDPNGQLNDLGPLEDDQAVLWRGVRTRAAGAVAAITLKDISAFRKWGPEIARFSFVLSPLAATFGPTGDAASPARTRRPRAARPR